jgi:hypothetical protein
MKKLLACLPLLLASEAQASDWFSIGHTSKHHEATSTGTFHLDAWDEKHLWFVDKSSVHREGTNMLVWTQVSNQRYHSSTIDIDNRQLFVIDCDEQRYKLIEMIGYSDNKPIYHFVSGDRACDVLGGINTECWPPAWGAPTWDHIVPDSMMETIVHGVCTGKFE